MLTYERYQALRAINIRVPGEPGNEASMQYATISDPIPISCSQSRNEFIAFWVCRLVLLEKHKRAARGSGQMAIPDLCMLEYVIAGYYKLMNVIRKRDSMYSPSACV